MEYRGERTQRISTRGLHLTHDINHDGTGLTKCGLDVRTLKVVAESATNTALGSRNRQTTDMNGTKVGNSNVAIWTDSQCDGLL